MVGWRDLGIGFPGQPFEIEGINVWDYTWKPKEGMTLWATAPNSSLVREFQVWEIVVGDKHIVFAAGEFTNNVYGFHVQEQSI